MLIYEICLEIFLFLYGEENEVMFSSDNNIIGGDIASFLLLGYFLIFDSACEAVANECK